MCSKISPVGEEKQQQSTRKSIRIKKRKNREVEESSSSLEAYRKMRTKTKRPKFLSLKLELGTTSEEIETKKKKKQKKQSKTTKEDGGDNHTTAFSKEKKVKAESVEEEHYNVAAYLFNSTTDSTISSIHDLLPSSTTVDLDCDLSPYDHQQEHGSSSSSLLRTAMRKGASKEEEEEETTEERWVSYSEVVEEVMSRSGTPQWCDDKRPSLTLKLDYEQIMEAWSDKGTLYVDGEPPQTVPDLHASAAADVSNKD